MIMALHERFESPEQSIEYMKRVAVGRSGFARWLGVEPIKVWQGQAELTLAMRDELTQHHGFAHGAVIGLMADNACAWAAASAAGDVVTGSYSINFLIPATGTLLRARGQVVKAGRKQVIVRADVWSESEGEDAKHVAVAQATRIPTGVPGR
jgi:uncharacterized protein (TIGR00369 family)